MIAVARQIEHLEPSEQRFVSYLPYSTISTLADRMVLPFIGFVILVLRLQRPSAGSWGA